MMSGAAVQDDEHWMRLAIELAAKGEGSVEPNPMVGCVLVKDGALIGQGYHRRFGEAHAEVAALRSLHSAAAAKDATAYVTLEPCCHHGKTPPCSEALIRAGVRRVVIALRDPFPQVDGGGIRQLRLAGIQVDTEILQSDAAEQNAPYLKRIKTGMPWVIAKWAMTVDGCIATAGGESQWISGAESRRHVHQLRSRVDAIMVGAGTAIFDDPSLTARMVDESGKVVEPQRTATRIVVCRSRIPQHDSQLFQTAKATPTLVCVAPQTPDTAVASLASIGVDTFRCQQSDSHDMLQEILRHLGTLGMTNVMIEGGAGIFGSLLGESAEQSLIDEFHVYVGAKVFGGKKSPSPVGGSGVAAIASAPRLRLVGIDQFEQDVRLVYRRR